MRFLVLLLACVCVWAGCSSSQVKFQKSVAGGPGYVIGEPIGKNGFVVKTNLGPVPPKYSTFYGYRAVGEECLARKFEYFDVAVLGPQDFEGYCYPTADHPGLGIEFKESGLAARPQQFIVANLNGKTKTLLEKDDRIELIDQTTPTSVATFKGGVFRAWSAGRKTVDLKIWRHDQSLEIKEPIALFKNSSMGSTQLDLVRSRTN